MSYIHSWPDLCATGWVGDPMSDLRPHLFSDADLAGCGQTQRSTSGVLHTVLGPASSFPIAVVCKRQSCVSHSTPEAEIVAMSSALRTVGLPAMFVWDVLLPGAKLVVREDNSTAIRVVETGRNPTMRHVGRTHGVSIAFLHEAWKAGHFVVEYVPSALQCADVFTKAFAVPLAWQAVCRLVNISSPHDIQHMVSSVGVPFGVEASAENKNGLWFVREDGSGSWVRRDRRADRFRQLRGAGPGRHEVTARHTICAKTHVPLGPPMLDYPTNPSLSSELPEPVPRDIVTVFEFRRTTQNVAESATVLPADAAMVPTIIRSVLS